MPRRPLKARLSDRQDKLPEGQPNPPPQAERSPTPDVQPLAPLPDLPTPVELAPILPGDVDAERHRLTTAKRDATGFVTDALPHITAAQLRWLTYRLESGDNLEACTASDTDPLTVLGWMADAGFRATFEAALDNKREGFKTLTSHLLPSVIRSLQGMLDTGNNKDKKEASALILRAQGLLVDKTSIVDKDAITTLFSLLREERPIEARVLDMTASPRMLDEE